jgi:hypothetical protein
MTGEWDAAEHMREFHFDSGLLVDAEFEQPPTKAVWEQAIAHAREADDPEEVIDEQLAATEERYRSGFVEVPEDHLDDMLAALEDELRRRAGMD